MNEHGQGQRDDGFTFLPDDTLNGVSRDRAGHRDRPAFHRLHRGDGADPRRTCEERRRRRKKMRWRLSLGSAKGGMDGRGVEPCGDYEAPFRGGKVLQYRKVGDERVTLN